MRPVLLPIPIFLLFIPGALAFAVLNPDTSKAFDHYISTAESRMAQTRKPETFLWIDANPAEKARAKNGEIVIVPHKAVDGGQELKVPGGQVQDWLGTIFIPKATLAQVRSVLQDYPQYKNFYRPEVIESKVVSHSSDDFNIFLRLYKHQVLTVVLNTNYSVHYGVLDPSRMYIESRSTRIAEVKDSKASYDVEHPAGNDTGFLWRLNSYWRFHEADGGVWAECEAISLSRDIPFGFGWMIRNFVQKFPKESMRNTLEGTAKAVAAR